jgi:hypothetical protein
MALTPLKAGWVVKEGVNSGNQGGEVNCLAQHLEVEARWPREAAAWPGSAGVRWKMELIGGAHLAVTEGEGVVAGLRQREKGDVFWPILHCHAGRDGPSARAACGRKGRWLAGLRGRAGRLAAGPIGPKAKENSFSNKNWIFEFIKALEICRKRFRRNFGMRIFPKFF